jgi:hypothetical protein
MRAKIIEEEKGNKDWRHLTAKMTRVYHQQEL